MKTTPTDDSDSKVFPCCMPPHLDGQGNFQGAILYPMSKRQRAGMKDPAVTLMLCIMHVSVRTGSKHPPLVEVEA